MISSPIRSSHILSASYDEDSRTLEIEFSSGTYWYDGVPLEVYQGLVSAPSAGRFFNQVIKGNYGERRMR